MLSQLLSNYPHLHYFNQIKGDKSWNINIQMSQYGIILFLIILHLIFLYNNLILLISKYNIIVLRYGSRNQASIVQHQKSLLIMSLQILS